MLKKVGERAEKGIREIEIGHWHRKRSMMMRTEKKYGNIIEIIFMKIRNGERKKRDFICVNITADENRR
jgi:hypothetical protein